MSKSTAGARVAESVEVDSWQWRQMLLTEHAPPIESHRIVALVVESYMAKERQHAWPSQATIARRAQLSSRQVRRILQTLEQDGWIRRAHVKRPGQRWRLTSYSPAVPLRLAAVVRDHPWEEGKDIQTSAPMSSPSNEAAATQMSPASRETGAAGGEVRTFGNGHADISALTCGHLTPDVRTSGRPTRSSSEVSIGGNHSEGAARGTVCDVQEPEESRSRIDSKIRTLKATGLDAHAIARTLSQYGVTVERVEALPLDEPRFR